MKKILLLLALTLPLALRAADTNTPVKISASQADKHYDQLMTVTGVVAQVSVRPGITFINLDKPHPDSPFVAILRGPATNQFANVKSLKTKSVEITGKIVNFHDRPEIVLTSSNLVVITSAPAVPAPAK